MKQPSAWLLLLLLCLSGFPAAGQTLPLYPAQLEFYERALAGYRFLLNQDRDACLDLIQDWYRPAGKEPYVFADMVIYENLRYPAISTVAPVTLYFQFTEVSGGHCEVSVAGLYDYNHPITDGDNPDLAVRMLLDINEMLNLGLDQQLNLRPVLEKQTTQTILSRYEDRRAGLISDQFLWEFPDRIGDSEATGLRSDPFASSTKSTNPTEDALVEHLALRFRRYTAAHPETRDLLADEEEVITMAILKDSLAMLRQEIRNIDLANSQLQLYLADATERDTFATETTRGLFSLPASTIKDERPLETGNTQTQIAELEAENLALRQALEDTATQLKLLRREKQRINSSRNDRALARIKAQTDSLMAASDARQSDLRETLAAQFTENESLKRQMTILEAERDSMVSLAIARGQELMMREKKIQALHQERRQQAMRLSRLKVMTDSLEEMVAILNPESERSTARMLIYRQRLDELQRLAARLTQREWEIEGREKRVNQRERFLAAYERNPDRQEALERINELENQLLKASEALPEATPTATISPAGMEIDGRRVPALIARTNNSRLLMEEKILAWARLQNVVVSGRRPFRIAGVDRPKISSGPITLILDLVQGDEEETLVFFAIHRQDGSYVETGRQDLPALQSTILLQDIIR